MGRCGAEWKKEVHLAGVPISLGHWTGENEFQRCLESKAGNGGVGEEGEEGVTDSPPPPGTAVSYEGRKGES